MECLAHYARAEAVDWRGLAASGDLETELTGKVAVVVGGGTEIGRATAVEFAREGACVVVAGQFGGLDAVANCAGVVHREETMLTGTVADFDRVIDVNLRGSRLVARAAAQSVVKLGDLERRSRCRRSTPCAQARLTTRRRRRESKG